MILQSILDHQLLLNLKGKTIHHLYYYPRHGWAMTFGLKTLFAMILNLDNIHPTIGFDSNINLAWLNRFQPHGLDRYFHDKKILDVHINDLNHVIFLLEHISSSVTKSLNLTLQLSPYSPRFFLKEDDRLIFDSIQGWQANKPIKQSKAQLNLDETLTVSKLVTDSLMIQYQDILESMIKKKVKRQEALSKDLAIHRRHFHYQTIAFDIQSSPNQAWDAYNNAHQLAKPSETFLTNFEGVTTLFNLYKKAKNGEKEVLKQMDMNQVVILELEKMQVVSKLINEETLKQVESYLVKNQLISGHKPKPVKVEHFSPYFCIDEGIKFSFGKNAKQNDHLTFSLAKKNEIFIHIKDYPGSHIILHHNQFDHELVLKGCQLALALANKLSAEVTYAKVGSLKRTTQIGQVIIKDHKTLKVNANPAWSDKILREVKRY